MQPYFLLSLLAAAGPSWASPMSAQPRQATTTVSDDSQTITSTSASATATPYDFRNGSVTTFPIHSSCNSTLHRQLSRALEETVELAEHARDHILRWGQSSPFVQKYFGNGTTATALGWYSRVAHGDRGNMTFRCDDPDRNCATQEGGLQSSHVYPTLYDVVFENANRQ